MKYGLSEAQFQQIVDFIAAYPEVEEAILFGSRAINTFKEASDVDIAIKGNNVTVALAQRMQFDIEEDSYLPFFFDVIAYPSIDNDALIQHIAHKGVVIYKRGVNAWREVSLDAVAIINPIESLKKGRVAKKISMDLLKPFTKKPSSFSFEEYNGGMKFRNGDTVVARITPCLENGKTAFIDILDNNEIGFGSTEYIVVREREAISDKHFLYYFAISPVFRDVAILSMTGSSGRQRVQTEVVKQHIFEIPPIPEQKAIAAVLSSLDDKIDLLHRQNKTLEAMAETLFKQWFVVEAKEDWKKGKLGDEFYFTMGQSPSSNSFNEEKIGVPMFQGNADFGFRFPSERVFTTEPTRFAGKFDTLISVRAPVGAQNMAHKECCIGRGVAAFRYKHNNDYYTYAYFKLRSLMEEIKQFNNEGTVFGSISKFDFENIAITIPSNEIIINFEKEVKPMNDKIIKNCYQIQTLETLRDTLLPKLMSGEIRVNPL